ncbi:MAG: CAP domain-containing protein [Pseudomonadota bacterium]
MLCLLLTGCVAAPPGVPVPATRDGGDALALASAERERRGLAPLTFDTRLAAAARDQAAVMARRGRIGHDGPGGSTVLERVRDAGVAACHMAENVAMGQASAAAVHADWMGSSGHRANILNRNVRSGAVAAVEGGGRLWWAMVLAGPC